MRNDRQQDENVALFKYVARAPDVADLENDIWDVGGGVAIANYWSGHIADPGRHSVVRLLWSDTGMHIRFEAAVAEPLTLNERPDNSQKTIGLWDRDVCEIFVAPDAAAANKYFEFEAAPTGEWLDVSIELTPKERISDWGYASGMSTRARIDERLLLISMEIPWQAFGAKPVPGATWLGNLFRCVGRGPDRGYLAWNPTKTELPNFHVPSAFGEFIFIK